MTANTRHTPTPDMQPDLGDVLQEEAPELGVVPVKICEPVEARELPSKRLGPRTVPLGSTVASKLLSRDPRRKSATIIARTQDILIGANQSQAQLSGAWVPGVVPLVITAEAELWAIGDGASTDVTVIEEYWA